MIGAPAPGGLGLTRFCWRTARTLGPALVGVAALALLTSFVVAAAPRQLTRVYDDALRAMLGEASDVGQTVTVVVNSAIIPDAEPYTDAYLELFGPALTGVVGDRGHAVETTALIAESPRLPRLSDAPPRIRIRLQDGFEDRVRFVRGEPPRPDRQASGAGSVAPLRAAISVATAERLEVHVGTRLRLVHARAGEPPIVVEITGVFEPLNPNARFWAAEPAMLGPDVVSDSPGGEHYQGVALVGPGSHQPLLERAIAMSSPPDYFFRYEIETASLHADNVAAVVADLERAQTQIGVADAAFAEGVPLRPRIESQLPDVAARYVDQRSTARAVLSLVLVGLLAVAFAVLALAVRVMAARAEPGLALARARGASLGQVAGLLTGAVALATVPAGLVGLWFAHLAVRSRPGVLSSWLAGLVLVALLAVTAALAARAHRTAHQTRTRDPVLRRPSGRRLTAEAFALLGAAVGILALRERGLSSTVVDGTIDLYASAAPVLAGLAVAMVALRVFPYPLRLLGGLTARRPGAISYLGIARASRESLTSATALVVLLVALSTAVFAGVLRTTLADGQQSTAWHRVGADARVEGWRISPETVDALERAPGVQASMPGYRLLGASMWRGANGVGEERLGSVSAYAIDPGRYETLLDGTPASTDLDDRLAAGTDRAGEPTPVLVSPRFAAEHDTESLAGDLMVDLGGGRLVAVEPVGTVEDFPAWDTSLPVMVLPYEDLRDAFATPLAPNTAWLFGDRIAGSVLRETLNGRGQAVGNPVVVTVDETVRKIRDGPFVGATVSAFALGLAFAAGYAVCAVVLAFVVTSATRARMLAYLRAIGFSAGQARALIALEAVPLAGTAVLVGVPLGYAIAVIVGPALDLASITGGINAPDLRLDLLTALGPALTLVAVVAVVVLVEARLARRTRLGDILRSGEER